MRKVFIAGDSPARAEEAAAAIRAAGCVVLSTWHAGGSPKIPADDRAAWADAAGVNRRQINDSDALVLLANPDHISGARRVAGGKFVNAGYADGRGKMVIVVGGAENGELNHPTYTHVPDLAGAVAAVCG